MNARGALVGILLAGLGVAALSSLAPGAKSKAPERVACNIKGDCAYVPRDFPPSNDLTFYVLPQRSSGGRFNF